MGGRYQPRLPDAGSFKKAVKKKGVQWGAITGPSAAVVLLAGQAVFLALLCIVAGREGQGKEYEFDG